MLDTLLTITALLALAVAAWALHRVEVLSRELSYIDVALCATRERAGVTDNDVDDYHDRIHPDCAEAGER